MSEAIQTAETAAERILLGAVRRWERAHLGQSVGLGTDLSAQLSTCRDYARAGRQLVDLGLLGYGQRLTMAGLRLCWAERLGWEMAERERLALVAAAEEARAQAERAAAEALRAERERQLAALRFLDGVQDLVRELRGLRDDLDALDACPGEVSPRISTYPPSPTPVRCTTSTPIRHLEICRSRQASCRDPRRAPILRLLPGGLVEPRKPSKAMVEAKRAYDAERAKGILFRAAKTWRLLWARYRWSEIPAGADLSAQLAGGRAFRRHWQPLLSMGLVRYDVVPGACVSSGTRVVLTEAGAAWLCEQMQPVRLAA